MSDLTDRLALRTVLVGTVKHRGKISRHYASDPDCAAAKAEIEKLQRVAEVAKALTLTVVDFDARCALVSEPKLTELESALEDAGYGITEAEAEAALGQDGQL
jgi:hypothetical protein